jgi:predicted ATPase/class 3 adenylate cyclase
MAATRQPSGTVTLVFTDIEGSTRLLESLGPESYRSALREHQRAVRKAFGRHGGYEVDTSGDGFFYAFSTATDAARAVGEALVALDDGPVRIRAGIHTGEPIVEAPKYIGLDVHRAARIMAAAHGGQALLSRTTRDLLDARFPIRDLGEHRLKDLSAPQRLFQVGIGDFPRPRTLHLTNLPVPATEFLGRDRELVDVVEKLRNGVRLLTLTGPGGTGKTRLALQAAAEAADDFAEGVWWVPLAALRDPGLVLRHTARTLDVVEQPERPLEEVLAEMLHGKRMLLVLDNAEHLLPGAANAIATLRDLEGPKLVVTSRERLQLTGEHVYPVPQLTPLEGLDLFTARAAAIDPGFQATGDVEVLCARLDNLPLAIELAAARTAVLRPEQILERLGGRLDLLKGARDADPRQQTLRATIAWSYDLLAPDERELCSRFSVFAGGATLEAVEEVSEADLDTLASLIDKSLLRRDGDRFWMLETIREYGRDQLDDTSWDHVIERHGAFYEQFAADAEVGLRGRDGASWLDLVEHELPNLRAAMGRALEGDRGARTLRIAAGLGRYWEARSSATEGRRWLDQALVAGPVEDGARAAGCFWAGCLAFFQGDLVAADGSLAEAAWAAQAAGDVFREAAACGYLGWVARERGDPTAGRVPLERSRALLTQITDPWERSEVLLPIYAGQVEDEVGVVRKDAPIVDQILALKRETGDVIAISDGLNNVGWEALLSGDLDRATANLEEAVAIARELDDTFRITLALCNLGLTAVLQERYADAVEKLRETLVLSIRRGDRRCGAEAVLGLAAAAAGLGEDELSVKLDAIHRALMADAGIVYEPQMLERLEPTLSHARTRLAPDRVKTLKAEVGPPTLDLALQLLDPRLPSIESPNE